MKVNSERDVAQSYPTLSDPMDCSLPGSSVHRIFQAKVLEWGTIAFPVKQLSKPQKKDKFKENLIQIHLNQTAKKTKKKKIFLKTPEESNTLH